jgi:alkylated DNA repair dioxygenase AlkB
MTTQNTLTRVPMQGADVSYLEHLDLGRPADAVLADLIEQIAWRQEDVVIQGRAYKQPRLTAWYGDPGMAYTYSGLSLEPNPWTPLLGRIKAEVEAVAGVEFNSALLNLYRHNRDSIGFHSDNEPELGRDPTIASLSLGHERVFILRPRWNKSLETHRLRLASGSLLIMAGATQRNWLHGIEKETGPCGPRVNITFRRIQPR